MTRLTEEYVLAKTRQAELSGVRNLNLWGNGIADISVSGAQRSARARAERVPCHAPRGAHATRRRCRGFAAHEKRAWFASSASPRDAAAMRAQVVARMRNLEVLSLSVNKCAALAERGSRAAARLNKRLSKRPRGGAGSPRCATWPAARRCRSCICARTRSLS
jgi:hypothetical protein